MSLDSRQAAQEALTAGRPRSSISRSDSAAYCAVTSKLVGEFTFDDRDIALDALWDASRILRLLETQDE